MDEQFFYCINWKIVDFPTRNKECYKFWPFKGRRDAVDSFGKVYNPSFTLSYKSEGNSSEKRVVSKFYLSVDGALPKDFEVLCSSTLRVVNCHSVRCKFDKKQLEHARVLLFYVTTEETTLRVEDQVMEYSRDFIFTYFTFIMYFNNSVTPKLTNTPAINVPCKRGCNLCSDFKKLFDSKEMADVTITVDGVSLLAHKFVLVTRSPVFKAMFDNDCLESNTKTIQITDADASIFKNFLKYLYCSEIGDKSYDMVLNLYVLADKYAVDGLKEDSRDILESELNEGTVCQLLEMSHLFRDETLSEKAVDFFKQHFSALNFLLVH
nr:protein maternal effect lethal 26 [Parasteatoda tepidariorum]